MVSLETQQQKLLQINLKNVRYCSNFN